MIRTPDEEPEAEDIGLVEPVEDVGLTELAEGGDIKTARHLPITRVVVWDLTGKSVDTE